MNNVYDIRTWQSAQKCGAIRDPEVRKAIRREQEAGNRGNHALWNTFEERRRYPVPRDPA